MHTKLLQIYHTLVDAFGQQHWWPGETRFEIMLGAILTQNTAWTNVERAIEGLKTAGLLDIEPLAAADRTRVERCIRPSGYFRQKAGRIIGFAQYLRERYAADLDRFFDQPLTPLRAELLGIKGIGPETADSILLYAGEKPIFVIDAYTFRIMERLGYYTAPRRRYHDLQQLFMDNLETDADLFNEYHALFVALGKSICKPKPRCDCCPLEEECGWG